MKLVNSFFVVSFFAFLVKQSKSKNNNKNPHSPIATIHVFFAQWQHEIHMLKINDQECFRNPSLLKQYTTDFFQSLYTFEGSRDFQPIPDQCPYMVQEHMNKALVSPIIMEEMENIVFQLGAIKAPRTDEFNGQFFQHH